MSKYGYENTFPGTMSAEQVKKAVWKDVYDTQEQPYALRETGIPAKESADEAIRGIFFAGERIFDRRSDGMVYCCQHRNDYTRAGFAFKTYDLQAAEPTKTDLALSDRIVREKAKLMDYEAAHNAKNRKSAFIGCKDCGSSVNKNFIGEKNVCPVCGASLFSKTDLDTIARYKENIRRWTREHDEKLAKRAKKSVVWFVSTSYH